MPFVLVLRKKLAALKEELDSGLLPQTLYEDLCRQAINSFGINLLEVDDTTLLPNLNNPAVDDVEKILESLPKEEKEKLQLIVQQQLQQQQQRQQQEEDVKHNLGSHTSILSVQSNVLDNADDHPYDSNSNNLVTINVNNSMYDYDALNDGQNYHHLCLVNEDNSNHNAKIATNNKNGNSATKSKQNNNNPNVNNNGANEFVGVTDFQRGDGRRKNKGSANRKSYSKEVKRRFIALRDSGLSVEEIAKFLDTARSNVEKWCSAKAREKILNRTGNNIVLDSAEQQLQIRELKELHLAEQHDKAQRFEEQRLIKEQRQ